MARLKVTARPIGSEDIEPSEEERRQLSEGEEDLTNVDADPSELMGVSGEASCYSHFWSVVGDPGVGRELCAERVFWPRSLPGPW